MSFFLPWFEKFSWYTNHIVFGFLLLQSIYYVTLLGIAFVELRRQMHAVRHNEAWWLLTSDVTIPISLLVPAYNEESSVVENIHSLLLLHYPEFEVIVVNDGSTDNTLKVAIDTLGLHPIERVHELSVPHKQIRGIYGSQKYPRLILVDKENGGKSDALNAAINLSRFPLVCAVDADSILDPDSLLRVVRPFIEDPGEMIAVGGRIRVVNGCKVKTGRIVEYALPNRLLPLYQQVEYTRAFLMARLAWSWMNTMLIISGAFGMFKRDALIEVGGYSHNTVGEDMEIVVKIHRKFITGSVPYKMRYVPDPVCWTEVPNTLKILRRQRSRWQRGMLETLTKHRRMVLFHDFGMVGVLGMGMFFLFDVIGPMVEIIGLVMVPISWILGVLSYEFLIAFALLMSVFGVFISVGSLFLEEISLIRNSRPQDLIILLLVSILENFGYRQINSIWRAEGTLQFLRGKKGWGKMTRTGFQKGEFKPGSIPTT